MPGWDRYDVPAHVQRAFDVPVLIDNDVNIMALGEQHAHLPDVDDLVFIKVVDRHRRRPDLRRRAAARRPGHRRRPRPRAGGARRRRHLPLRQRGLPRGDRGRPGAGRGRCGTPGWTAETGQDVVDLVRGGDPVAAQVVRQAGRDLGEVVATLVNVINPSAIVIGGALADAGESLIAGIREVVYQRSLPLATEHLRIVTSQAGERAGVLGAAALAIGHVLSPESIDRASVA